MEKFKDLIRILYKNEQGDPFEATLGQVSIFESIFKKSKPRVSCLTYTQYGKSEMASMAILARATAFGDRFTVVAPTDEKAQIIVGKVIDHIFDDPITVSQFQIDRRESLEKIRRSRSRNHVTFRTGDGKIGGIQTLSAQGRTTKDILSATLGFGSANIVLDESPLLSEEHYAGILRMLGGHKENFLIEFGNAINRNHFMKTFRDPDYLNFKIDYKQGIGEGRQKAEYFEEMKRKMRVDLFRMLYECEFPSADAIDSDGYSPLLTDADLERALVDEVQLFGERRLAIDVAGGGRNKSVIVLGAENGAKVLQESESGDTMGLVGSIIHLAEKYKVLPENIFIDKMGVGKGAYDRLQESGFRVNGVAFGAIPEERDVEGYGQYRDGDNFLNLRAQCFWRMSEKIKSGFRLKKHPGWNELLEIRYKVQSDKKLKIISKEELLRKGIESPDYADALAMLFARRRKVVQREELTDEEIKVLTNVYK